VFAARQAGDHFLCRSKSMVMPRTLAIPVSSFCRAASVTALPVRSLKIAMLAAVEMKAAPVFSDKSLPIAVAKSAFLSIVCIVSFSGVLGLLMSRGIGPACVRARFKRHRRMGRRGRVSTDRVSLRS
jgi:hypothetical protein